VKLGDVVQDTHGVILVLDKQEQKVQSFGGKNGAGVEVPRETRSEFERNTKIVKSTQQIKVATTPL
jgi:hypothetical protein